MFETLRNPGTIALFRNIGTVHFWVTSLYSDLNRNTQYGGMPKDLSRKNSLSIREFPENLMKNYKYSSIYISSAHDGKGQPVACNNNGSRYALDLFIVDFQ